MPHPKGDQAFRNPDLHGRWPEMTYGGALSFLRRRYTRDLRGVDVAVTGIPLDITTSYRPGARLGPAAVRAASAQLAELPAFPWGFDPFERLAVVDYGDCYLDFGHPERIPEAITAHAREILAGGARLLSLGGDHFSTYPLLRAHAERHGPLALLQFDAHPDTWPDDGHRLDHGTMFRRAAEEGIIDVDHSVQVGIRTHAEPMGFTVLDAPWVHDAGPRETIRRIRDAVAGKPVYLTFDIDCLDPGCAPGTGTPVPGGLSSAQALAIMRGLAGVDFIGMDVVEVAPPYDTAGITALAAAHLAHDWLCLLASRR
ncbi:agmatinase [Sediminicurvatus halobius]|uniref:Agmatinase n=1 Tax=Sediminicurvatus halobius TaxID=2182432 RepID=A0A2U2N209_9GAMM|nr:agmatinase [Spiribacter halobius]PWG63097.1 agmatinase [Spiribacter halobius]UEX77547.1 agmatinase [Spiribacter halobius]